MPYIIGFGLLAALFALSMLSMLSVRWVPILP